MEPPSDWLSVSAAVTRSADLSDAERAALLEQWRGCAAPPASSLADCMRVILHFLRPTAAEQGATTVAAIQCAALFCARDPSLVPIDLCEPIVAAALRSPPAGLAGLVAMQGFLSGAAGSSAGGLLSVSPPLLKALLDGGCHLLSELLCVGQGRAISELPQPTADTVLDFLKVLLELIPEPQAAPATAADDAPRAAVLAATARTLMRVCDETDAPPRPHFVLLNASWRLLQRVAACPPLRRACAASEGVATTPDLRALPAQLQRCVLRLVSRRLPPAAAHASNAADAGPPREPAGTLTGDAALKMGQFALHQLKGFCAAYATWASAEAATCASAPSPPRVHVSRELAAGIARARAIVYVEGAPPPAAAAPASVSAAVKLRSALDATVHVALGGAGGGDGAGARLVSSWASFAADDSDDPAAMVALLLSVLRLSRRCAVDVQRAAASRALPALLSLLPRCMTALLATPPTGGIPSICHVASAAVAYAGSPPPAAINAVLVALVSAACEPQLITRHVAAEMWAVAVRSLPEAHSCEQVTRGQ